MIKYLLLLLIISANLFSRVIDESTAFIVANNFLINNGLSLNGINNTNLVMKASRDDGSNYYYVFGDEEEFVIVSGHDEVVPILAYSTESGFDPKNIPQNAAKWLESYKKQIRYILENDIKQPNDIAKKWDDLYKGKKFERITSSVGPLVSAKWNQGEYYNDLCPWDSRYNDRAVTGCVATAMAMIMHHHSYPEKGEGIHSYVHEQYGTLSANFGATTYNWNAMPNSVSSRNTSVATLMYHCGVAVNMNYDVSRNGGSGAYVIESQYYEASAEEALKTYFGYNNAYSLLRDNNSESEWVSTLKAELDKNHPILYAGFGNGGGHAFVCDGYDNNDYFHFNWGWGGYYDGYFYMNELNPGGVGTGGGSGGYNSGQQIIVGIYPTNNQEINTGIVIQDDVEIESDTIALFSEFEVKAKIANNGKSTFSGEYCAAVFDEDNNFVEIFGQVTETGLESGYYYNNGLEFKNDGSLKLIPGNYNIFFFYKESGGEWKLIEGYDNYTKFYVQLVVVNYQYISLYSPIDIYKADELYSNSEFIASVDIANFYNEDFTGELSLNLYNADGQFVQQIESYEIDLSTMTYDTFNFYTDKIEAEPGSYILSVMHYWPGQENLSIVGTYDNNTNPIYIVVKEPLKIADYLENNNTIETSSIINLNYNNNYASSKISDVSIHDGEDVDYYKLKNESGYKYTVNIRLQDSFNSSDNGEYDLDALWSFSTNGIHWSETYDDVIASPIQVDEDDEFYIKVAPYFQGETGNYALDIEVQRNSNEKPEISVAADLNFGEVEIGKSVTKKFSIYNLGKAALQINNIDTPIRFDVDWNDGVIPASSAKEVTITFTPSREKNYNNELIIHSNDENSPEIIPIIASGITPVGINEDEIEYYSIIDGVITFRTKGISYKLIDINGSLVKQGISSLGDKFDCNSLLSGTYILMAEGNNNKVHRNKIQIVK